jgi:hypothetical protein
MLPGPVPLNNDKAPGNRYVVKAVLNKRKNKRRIEYLVK